jgi:CO/xanthine dehydrogenase Mo-binding subunit
MVAAETLEAAEEAISLIRVDYEDLPPIFSPEDALAPDAIKICETGNVLLEKTLIKGNPDQGLEESDIVITNTYRTQMVEHAYLEPEAGVANYEGDKLTVWMPCKYAHFDHREIAEMLGLPRAKMKVINTTIGGSFGDKICLAPGYYAALACLVLKRPAKMVYTREESFSPPQRHPIRLITKWGA